MSEDLVELALRDPERARIVAATVIDSSTDARDHARARQALAIVLRENGDHDQALRHVRLAARHATRTEDADLLADIRATEGVTLILAGRTQSGLRALNAAAAIASGAVQATILMRRGSLLTSLGRAAEGAPDLEKAVRTFRMSSDSSWLARTLNNLGYTYLSVGRVRDADRAFNEAAAYYAAEGASVESAYAQMNQARTAFLAGDLVRALRLYERIYSSCIATGRALHSLAEDRAQLYLAAGLSAEAISVLNEVPRARLPALERADLDLQIAQAAIAGGAFEDALSAARRASAQFRRQRRGWHDRRARLVRVIAELQLSTRPLPVRAAMDVATALHAERAEEAPQALIVAGRLDPLGGYEFFRSAAEYRAHPSPLVRMHGWLGQALQAEVKADRSAVARACRRALEAVDDYRRTMGSSELQALASSHGADAARTAIRNAAHDGRALLRWSERWRATALAQVPVRASRASSAQLAILRDTTHRLAEARRTNQPIDQLERERRRAESAVRSLHHQQLGAFDQSGERLDIDRLIGEVSATAFVELVDVDGTLHVLVVSRGRVRRRVAGTVAEALELAERGRFALRRAARGGSFDPGDLDQRLQEVLLGDAVRVIPDGPVVIAPTVRLHGAPWALLPCLADRPFSLVPSAAQWLRAGEVKPPRSKTLHLIAGPGLGTGGAEVPRLKRRHPDAVLLRGRKATVDAALAALDGARLAHVAAHGHFRADSPLFSSLEMADGPLTVYELERLKRAPYRLVLSACESGVLAPVGAEELLGLAAALFSLGSAGLVCSIAEVNDEATASLMVTLHDELAAGADPAAALHAVRRAAAGDALAAATAAAFVALGR
jgi:tetratricopeptide (TPR) repeat protein